MPPYCLQEKASQLKPTALALAFADFANMLEALAASQAVGASSSEGRGRGKGKGKGKAAGASSAKVLKKLIPAIVQIDRRLGALEDRGYYVVLLHDETWKSQVEALKQLWKRGEESRRKTLEAALKEWEKDKTAEKPKLGPHELGGSQRSAVLKLLAELLSKTLPSDNPARARVDYVAKAPLSELDNFIFRAKPRHPTPKEGKPWIWAFAVQEFATLQERGFFTSLAEQKIDQCRVAPQHSMDGPVMKWLLEWLKEGRKQTEEDGEFNSEEEGMSDYEFGAGRKRRARGD